jgi:hypothetical protein
MLSIKIGSAPVGVLSFLYMIVQAAQLRVFLSRLATSGFSPSCEAATTLGCTSVAYPVFSQVSFSTARVVHRAVPVKVIWRFAALSRFTTKNEGYPCERNLEGA